MFTSEPVLYRCALFNLDMFTLLMTQWNIILFADVTFRANKIRLTYRRDRDGKRGSTSRSTSRVSFSTVNSRTVLGINETAVVLTKGPCSDYQNRRASDTGVKTRSKNEENKSKEIFFQTTVTSDTRWTHVPRRNDRFNYRTWSISDPPIFFSY